MRYILPRGVLRRARNLGGRVAADLEAFLQAKAAGRMPPRLDKPCGFGADQRVSCVLHVNLGLRHYRLTAHADPLLIYQQLEAALVIVDLARHRDIFHGNEHRWCHARQELIDWTGNDHHLAALNIELGVLR